MSVTITFTKPQADEVFDSVAQNLAELEELLIANADSGNFTKYLQSQVAMYTEMYDKIETAINNNKEQA